MDKQDREYIIKELKEFGEWLKDSSGHNIDDPLNELVKSGGGDYYVFR